MAQSYVWIETTRAGNFQVRVRENGKNRTEHTIDKMDQMVLDVPITPDNPTGKKKYSGKALAKEYVRKVKEKFHKNQFGYVDQSDDINDLVAQYLQERRSNNYEETTLEHNEDALKPFIADNNLRSPGDIDSDCLKEWKVFMMQKGLSVNTIRGRLGDVHTFCRWLIKGKKLLADPFEAGMMPMKKDLEPRYYTAKEWLLLDAASRFGPPGIRVLCNLTHGGGLRKSEALGAQWEDLTWRPDGSADLLIRREVAKRKKKSRSVTLTPEIMEVLGSRRSGPLVNFPIKHSADPKQEMKSRKYAADYHFQSARKLAGINPELTIHGLRHTFAKDYLQSGAGNLKSLGDVMGHSDIESTQIYAQFEQSYIRQGMGTMYEYRMLNQNLAKRELPSTILQGKCEICFAGKIGENEILQGTCREDHQILEQSSDSKRYNAVSENEQTSVNLSTVGR